MMNIKKFGILLLSLLAFAATASAQPSPVMWSIKAERVDSTVYDVKVSAMIDRGWHIYDFGPYDNSLNPTRIAVAESDACRTVGGVTADKEPHRAYDDLFGMEIGTWDGQVTFTQRVELLAPSATVNVTVEYSACDDRSCMPPQEEELSVALGTSDAAAAPADGAAVEAAADNAASEAANGSGRSLWGILLAAAGWALAALLTPCVFPMIPMTVSFFVKGGANGRFRALMYGVFIVALYTLPIAALIVITRLLGGDTVTADIFNWLATHWLPNLIFFLVFMVFAASFFGAFEITLPSSWVNQSDKNADRRGLLGVFFLALTLVLVSFSCTGPIVSGAVIEAVSSSYNFWSPILTMLVFSVVFALPFVLFALFPSMMQKLPKSGGWLNSVKVVLGFIELALGFKFLSVADQTYHWGLLDREIYLAIWIVIFTMLGFYLLGKLRFAHDSEVKHVTVPRLALSICVFTFVVYMIPGMWGAPLKALSGYLPPLQTQDFILGQSPLPVIGGADGPTSIRVGAAQVKYGDFLSMPHGITGYFEWNEALAAARAAGKPLFVDVTGHGCVNCREMEQKVLSDERVQQILRDDYIVVALYTDDKARAAGEDWVTTEGGTTLKEIGRINSYIARKRFNVNAQPNYIVADAAGAALLPPRGYDLSVEGFVDFLERGVAAYKARTQP